MNDSTKDDILFKHVKQSIEQSLEAKKHFYETHSQVLIDAARLMADTIVGGGKIMLAGNGGSAADAQHMAAEMTGRMLIERKIYLPALALTTDTSALSAIANDFSYDNVFEFQLRALGRKGDLFLAISTSGNSKNILKAAEAAKKIGIKILSLTGGTGGQLKAMSDYNLNVEKGKHSSMIQETHITAIHLLVDIMDRFLLPQEYVTR